MGPPGGLSAVVGVVLLGLAIYCAVDPFKHSPIHGFPEFVSHKVDLPDWSDIPTMNDPINQLQRSEIKFKDIQGPESLAFDPLGRGPYTGVADGRVLFWNGHNWIDFAYTSANRSGICEHQASPLKYLKNEHICGRPLGLRFDKRTGDLYIADAYFGLMKVGAEGGLATSLVSEVEGVPLQFTNDLDIDEEGNVYFTDSSTNYQRRNFLQSLLSWEDTGRVLKYDPVTKKTSVLVKNLRFANGLTLSKDGSFLLYCETILGSLNRYWLKGEKAGTSELFAILPGIPDNVRTNQNGEFWVALHCRRSKINYILATRPGLRNFLLNLPIKEIYHYLSYIGGWPHGMVAKYSPEGELLQVLEDLPGKVVRSVSEVEERNGKLWMGSVLMSFIAVYDLSSSHASS